MINIDYETFGREIRNRRKEMGLTQVELAGRAGISRNYLSQLERGKATNLSLRIFNALTLTTVIGDGVHKDLKTESDLSAVITAAAGITGELSRLNTGLNVLVTAVEEGALFVEERGELSRLTALNSSMDELLRVLKEDPANAGEALRIMQEYNPLRDDMDAFLYEIGRWGLGERSDRPAGKDYGIA
jgi:transcriptional regulator with XRE-family HTH domain